ncbi:MAG: hypothetical protein AAFX53_10145 [Bacteroidota bacterium]
MNTTRDVTFSLEDPSNSTLPIDENLIKTYSFDPNPLAIETASNFVKLNIIVGDGPTPGSVLEYKIKGKDIGGVECSVNLKLTVNEPDPCTDFTLDVSPPNSSLEVGAPGSVSIVSTILPGFAGTVDLSLQLEDIDGTPTEVIGQDLIDQNILMEFLFTPPALNNDLTGSMLNFTVGEAAMPNSVYTFNVVGTDADSGTLLCSETFTVNTASCPLEECAEGSFLVLGGSCIAEADAIHPGNLLENPGFVTDAFGTNFPNVAGGWSGDGVTQVMTENGINPPEGDHMLRFDFADLNASSALSGSEIAQLYVLSENLKDRIDNGGESITIRQEVFFNRVAGDANTDTEFIVLIIAFDGPTTDFAEDYLNRADLNLVRASSTVSSDACTNTWERLGAQIVIPQGTNYIGVVLVATEDVENDTTGTEFDGHYVDAASLFIVE